MERSYDIVNDNLPKTKKREYWDVAFGLQAVDNLSPSSYMRSLANDHVEGKKSYYEVSEAINSYYSSSSVAKNNSENEADKVSRVIFQILSDDAFSFNPLTLKNYHKLLFKGINDELFHPGEFRTVNITKKEPILAGRTVQYEPFFQIEEALNHDFSEEENFNYSNLSAEEKVSHLAEFTSKIWQIHPFMEGNTQTTAIFIEKYLLNLGYSVDNLPFEKNSKYFRNALVRANFSDAPNNISRDPSFLENFFKNLLLDENNPLKNSSLELYK